MTLHEVDISAMVDGRSAANNSSRPGRVGDQRVGSAIEDGAVPLPEIGRARPGLSRLFDPRWWRACRLQPQESPGAMAAEARIRSRSAVRPVIAFGPGQGDALIPEVAPARFSFNVGRSCRGLHVERLGCPKVWCPGGLPGENSARIATRNSLRAVWPVRDAANRSRPCLIARAIETFRPSRPPQR